MASVGYGARIGVLPESRWNNPEPELVLAVDSRGQIVGATLGNDVNLRDVEGRSALLLTRAKDNNGSCAIGPFIRLFDADFTLDSVRAAEVALRIDGPTAFAGRRESDEPDQPRPAGPGAPDPGRAPPVPGRLHAVPGHHVLAHAGPARAGQRLHPRDGRPRRDRLRPLGALVNEVGECTAIAPWDFGLRALYASLARRGCWRGRHGLRSGRGAGRSRGPAWPACHATVCEPRSGWLEQGHAGRARHGGGPANKTIRAGAVQERPGTDKTRPCFGQPV